MYQARFAADLLDYGIYVLIMGSTWRRDYGINVATCRRIPGWGQMKFGTAQGASRWP